jgi:hypothetical protein
MTGLFMPRRRLLTGPSQLSVRSRDTTGSDNCTGMGVVSGFLAAVLIIGGPHVKHVDPDGRISFLHILQEISPVCKNLQPVQHLIERVSQYLGQGHSLDKSSPDYEELYNYGTITDTAA